MDITSKAPLSYQGPYNYLFNQVEQTNQNMFETLGGQLASQTTEETTKQTRTWGEWFTSIVSPAAAGKMAGERFVATYGQGATNAAIKNAFQLCVSRGLMSAPKQASGIGSYIGSFFGRSAETAAIAGLQLTFGPAVTYLLTVGASKAGEWAAPKLLSAIKSAYTRVMGREKTQEAPGFKEKLDIQDAMVDLIIESLRDILTEEDIYRFTKQGIRFDISCQLLEIYETKIRTKYQELVKQAKSQKTDIPKELEAFSKKTLTEFFESYCVIHKEENFRILKDGTCITNEDWKKTVEKGITYLTRLQSKENKIQSLIKFTANHSIKPRETISSSEELRNVRKEIKEKQELQQPITPRYIPGKTPVILNTDGQFVRLDGKGTLKPKEVKKIVKEYEKDVKRQKLDERREQETSLRSATKLPALVKQLNNMYNEDVEAYINSFQIYCSLDHTWYYPNGDTIPPNDNRVFHTPLPAEKGAPDREKKIQQRLSLISAHLPKDRAYLECQIVDVHDDKKQHIAYINYQGEERLSDEQVKQMLDAYEAAEIEKEVNDFVYLKTDDSVLVESDDVHALDSVPNPVQLQQSSYWERMKSFVAGTTRTTVMVDTAVQPKRLVGSESNSDDGVDGVDDDDLVSAELVESDSDDVDANKKSVNLENHQAEQPEEII